ncbi:hypothetical protein OSTOST_18594, partial [Ostertagia ostertagi]
MLETREKFLIGTCCRKFTFQMVACKLGRFYVNEKQMLDVNYVLRNGDSIHHWGHRHEHPSCFFYSALFAHYYVCVDFIVLHRLDRATSGVLMFAKNYETDSEFKKTLKEGDWSKEYVCMVEGEFP